MNLDARLKRLETALSDVPAPIHLVVVLPGQAEEGAIRDTGLPEDSSFLLIVGSNTEKPAAYLSKCETPVLC